jgi:thiamine-phosphate pyrophosphorylase
MSLIRDLAEQIVACHQQDDLSIAAPESSIHQLPPALDNTHAGDHYELAGALAAIQMGFIETDAQVLGKAWSRMAHHAGGFNPASWPSLPDYFDLMPTPHQSNASAFPSCPHALDLYAVLPSAEWVKRMVDAEVPTVQLRYKAERVLDRGRLIAEINTAVAAVKGSKTLLFINDYWREAIDAGAYGVHLGQEDLALADLEAIRKAGLRLGLSTHGYAEMVYADSFLPSYIAMGAVFPTQLKHMPTSPQGLGRLRKYVQLMNHYPLVGIGGIDESTIQAVAQTGVGSVAVVRAITGSNDPEAAVKRLTQLMAQAKTK